MIDWIKTVRGHRDPLAAGFATMNALPRFVFSPKEMSDRLPLDLNSDPPWHRPAPQRRRRPPDPNRDFDEFRIAHVQRPDGWIATTWNNMSEPGTFAAAGPEEQQGGEPPPLTGARVVVCLMG